jgi:hypothetical protein
MFQGIGSGWRVSKLELGTDASLALVGALTLKKSVHLGEDQHVAVSEQACKIAKMMPPPGALRRHAGRVSNECLS